MARDVFPVHTEESAPEGARRTLRGVAAQFGFLPAAAAMMAESPETLKGFLAASSMFEQTTLTPIERETVVLAVATRNGCELCVALHTRKLRALAAEPELIDAMRERKPLPDNRLAALWTFADNAMDRTGAVTNDELAALFAAGFTARNALEVVLGIGTYTLSTFANRLTEAPIDPGMVPAAHGTAASSVPA